jgi:tRNA(Ile2) C34 agmatinyltransferase TiaS
MVRRMTDDTPACPECGRPMKPGGFVLARREDDGRRACRSLLKCVDRHVWWSWADRPDEPLEIYPVPELFH